MTQNVPAVDSGTAPLPAADTLLRQHRTENFPVALRILPRGLREHLFALYGYARLVDDVGDELSGDRLAALDRVDAELDAIFAGGEPQHPILVRLARSVRAKGLSEGPLRRLIEANRIDQRTLRYPSWSALAQYCDDSANPVGELVLEIFDVATPQRVAHSNRICTALQLIEHCQDVREDLLEKGRVYLPEEDLRRFSVTEQELRGRRASPAFRALLRFEAQRARALLRQGGALLGTLTGWARLAVAGFAAGGHAALDAIEAADGDVLGQTPRPGRARTLRHLVSGLSGARRT